MTPNQLPPMPEPDGQMTVTFGIDEKRKVPVFFGGKLTDYALAALAQQAQEPVSPDMHGWCAYVGGMVAHWVMSEPNAHVRLGDDQFEAAIAGIIERRLWAMPKRDTTPQPQPVPPVPPVPAPVDEREAFEAWIKKDGGDLSTFGTGKNTHYHNSAVNNAWTGWKRRAALQSTAPKAGGGWLPIETAPKDGTLFMCWVDAVIYAGSDEGQQFQNDVSQVDFCAWHAHDDTPDGGWFEPCCGHVGDAQRVTHWQPLPPAPQATKGQP